MTYPDTFICLQLAFLITLSCILSFTVAQNPVDTYAPTVNVNCPETPNNSLLRTFTPQNQVLNTSETEYIASRESYVISNAWSNWLGNASDIGYNFENLEGKFPRIGIAVGGEGYRTAQYGAAVLSGLDWRNTTAREGGTGGLLQVASYLSASSGGSWLLGSLLMNDWPSINELVYGNGGNLSSWMLDLDLIVPSSALISDSNNQEYWGSILASVESKANNGLPTSATDIWGRMISYHFLNETTLSNFYTNQTSHGAGQLWSQMSLLPSFQNYTIPFPIVAADSREGSGITTTVPLNSTVYEITPFEFGSWDPGLGSMLPLKFAGTYLTNGLPANSSACITGFDQASFVMGTSSSFFNAFLNVTDGNFEFDTSDGDEEGMNFVFNQLLSHTPSNVMNAANWPNPFKGVNAGTFQDSSSDQLELLDGGSNGEKTPLSSLLVNARGLDVVVVIDGSADDQNYWPNGTSLLTTFDRISSVLSSSHQPMPPIPGTATQFISTGVNMRPTFFGCNLTQDQPAYPIIIYLPNAPPLDGSAPATNTGDTQFSYTSLFTAVFINQAFSNTLGGFKPNTTSPDPNWGQCLQCAAIDRAVNPRSDFCSQCFAQYCYNPNNLPSQSELPDRQFVFVDPDPGGLQKVEVWLTDNKGALAGFVVAIIVVIAGIIGFIFWWRIRRARKSRYSRVDELREDDDPWRYYDSRSLELTPRMSIT